MLCNVYRENNFNDKSRLQMGFQGRSETSLHYDVVKSPPPPEDVSFFSVLFFGEKFSINSQSGNNF